MPPPRSLLVIAALLAGCGTTYSPSYGVPLDARAATDAAPALDAPAPLPDTSTPLPDAPVRDVPPARLGAPYPILLHHGFAGFRDIGPLDYFYRVATDLRARGDTVYETEVNPFATPSARAAQLAVYVDRALEETGRERVVLIAHSQGGLDARYLISTLGYGDRVALLVTVATPHHGTRIADAIAGATPSVADDLLDAVATVFGYAYNEVRDRADLRGAVLALSEANMRVFNEQNPDDPRVRYWSWTGRTNRRTGEFQCAGGRIPNDTSRVDDVLTVLYPFARFLEDNDPVTHVNDGMVEVSSARWGTFMGCVPADHFDEVGQIARTGPVPGSGFDHLVFYRDVVRRAREAGF